MSSSPESLLYEAAQIRARALTLRQLTLQAQPGNPLLDDAIFNHIVHQLRDALVKEEDARQMQLAEERASRQQQTTAAAAGQSQLQDDASTSADGPPPVATAAALTAVALPLGMVTLGSAIAAAPYLGVDLERPLGLRAARARVSATLRRDSGGKFRLLLREDEAGVYIFAAEESDAEDDRALLKEGDYVATIDGFPVRAAQQASQPPAGDRTAASPASANPVVGSWSLDEVKEHVRRAATSVIVEVWREEIRPTAQRLGEFQEQVFSEVKKIGDSASELAKPHLERSGVLPHLERAGSNFGEMVISVQGQVQQVLGGASGCGDGTQQPHACALQHWEAGGTRAISLPQPKLSHPAEAQAQADAELRQHGHSQPSGQGPPVSLL